MVFVCVCRLQCSLTADILGPFWRGALLNCYTMRSLHGFVHLTQRILDSPDRIAPRTVPRGMRPYGRAIALACASGAVASTSRIPVA